MKVELGLHKIIDSNYEDWKAYPLAIKLDIVSSDIEIYGRIKYNNTMDIIGRVSVSMINELMQEFSTVPFNDKEYLKNTYTKYIDANCKPDLKGKGKLIKKEKTGRDEAYTEKDEYKAVKEAEVSTRTKELEADFFIARSAELKVKYKLAKLSAIEIHSLNYLKDKNIKKHYLLEMFTFNGILQIANRAAYKLFLQKKQDTRTITAHEIK